MKARLEELLDSNVALILLLSVLSASLALNVVLGWKVRRLSLQARLPTRGGIQERVTLPPIPATDESGRKVTLTFGGTRSTVVYVLSPSCAWCKRNEANTRALAAARSDAFRFVGLATSRENLYQRLREVALGFEVFVVESPDLVSSLGLEATPQTAVVKPDGVVQKVWVGALSGAAQQEVEEFFGVHLPGLTPTSGEPSGTKH